jgi:hypothetical protein
VPTQDRGHARSGRKDPAVAARIRQQQVIGNGEEPVQPEMPEITDAEAAYAAALQAQREAEGAAPYPPQPQFPDAYPQPDRGLDAPPDEYDEDEPLYPGDSMVAKGGYTFNVDGESAWSTFESSTTIQPGESELHAFERLNAQLNTRLMDVAADLEERVIARNEQRNAQRRARRIVPIDSSARPYN